MKIYVAGRFEEKDAVQRVQQLLRDAGHTITFDWTGESDTLHADDPVKRKAYRKQNAQRDKQGVKDCDLLVQLVHHQSHGAYVELGIAMGLEKPLIAYNYNPTVWRDCVFFELDEQVVIVKSDGQLLFTISNMILHQEVGCGG